MKRAALPGYRRRGSHDLLPVTHCPIAAPLLEQAVAAVTRIGAEAGLESLCEEVEFFTNNEQDQLLVSLWPGAHRQPARLREQTLEAFAELLHTEMPVLTGVGLFAEGEMMHWGQRSLTYTVSGHSYQASLGGFFQVNRFLLPGLLQLAVENSDGEKRSGRTAWDLYSGAGLFARALDFENVTAVESAGFSADDLKHNLAGKAHRVVRSSTLDFLRSQTRGPARAKPELILLDPPRAGLGKEICGPPGKYRRAWHRRISPAIRRRSLAICSYCCSLSTPCRRFTCWIFFHKPSTWKL